MQTHKQTLVQAIQVAQSSRQVLNLRDSEHSPTKRNRIGSDERKSESWRQCAFAMDIACAPMQTAAPASVARHQQ